MDAVIPTGLSGALEGARRTAERRRSRYSVRWQGGELPLLELTARGFVIEADRPPHIRGYMDIFEGDERMMRGLVLCTWARDGLVGYEFKRGAWASEIRVDHALPVHSGLLDRPR